MLTGGEDRRSFGLLSPYRQRTVANSEAYAQRWLVWGRSHKRQLVSSQSFDVSVWNGLAGPQSASLWQHRVCYYFWQPYQSLPLLTLLFLSLALTGCTKMCVFLLLPNSLSLTLLVHSDFNSVKTPTLSEDETKIKQVSHQKTQHRQPYHEGDDTRVSLLSHLPINILRIFMFLKCY